MKKYLIILLALPLIATSCLKDDEDKFDKSASERIQEFLDNTSKVLSEAPNGWVVEYYPSAEQEYGGLRMYMKFDASKNEVTVASEAGASDETAKSYYSFGEDYGPTLNFDTYNKLLHCYSEPYGSVGEANIGWGGDYEFIISSVDADEVVLTGKKSKNRIVLTPAATADWKMDFEAYRIAAATMDEMLSYQLEIGSRVYQMSRDVLSAYNSRHFTINTVPATQVGYIYTTTGIKFYEPLTIDNVTIAEMDWEDGKFVDPVTGCEISQIMTDDTYEVSTSNVAIKSANVTVKPGNPNTYYVIGAYAAADAQTKSDAAICNEIMSKINSVNDLFSGEASTTLALKAETEYIACAFSVTIINEYIYPTSGLSKSAPFTTLEDVPMKDEYKAWLGTWTLTSTSSEVTGKPVVLDLGIGEEDRNSTYAILGWDIGVGRNEYPQITTLSGKNMVVTDRQVVGIDGNYEVTWCALSSISGDEGTYLVGGLRTTFTLSLNADGKSATVTPYSGNLQNGGTFRVESMTMFGVFDGNYYYMNPAPGYTAQDFPLGPYTMVKTGDAPAAAAAAARKTTYKVYMVDVEKYSKVEYKAR